MMVNKAVRLMLVFIVMCGFISTSMAGEHRTTQYHSQLSHLKSQNIKLNALKREYPGTHARTLGHRYKATYHYRSYQKVTTPRYIAMVPSRYYNVSARSYWP